MLLNNLLERIALRICRWQTGRYIQKAAQTNKKVDYYIKEASAWLDLQKQYLQRVKGDST